MQTIPLQAIPSQVLNVTLGNQACQLNVYQSFYGVFVDLYSNNILIIAGTLALNLTRMVRDLYLGFIGDLAFVDTQPDPILGPLDPYYTGLGSRYQLIYLEASDLPPGVG